MARFLAPAPKGTRARDREPSCQRMHWLLPGEPAITRPTLWTNTGVVSATRIYQAASFAWLKGAAPKFWVHSRRAILGVGAAGAAPEAQ